MPINIPFTTSPLGDSAVLISFGNVIDREINETVLAISQKLNTNKIGGIKDIVPAYASLAIHYDIIKIRSVRDGLPNETITNWVNDVINEMGAIAIMDTRKIKVPVCYAEKYAIDMQEMEQKTKLTADQIIEIHTSKKYRVYMLGFLPGFAYMGEVDERILMPRKDQPRLSVDAGSVGIAGKQTGIYPLASPGGWQIIGRTPLALFDKNNTHPVLFNPGDEVEFYSITEDEFENYKNGTV